MAAATAVRSTRPYQEAILGIEVDGRAPKCAHLQPFLVDQSRAYDQVRRFHVDRSRGASYSLTVRRTRCGQGGSSKAMNPRGPDRQGVEGRP
jgi:hypothetical protein